ARGAVGIQRLDFLAYERRQFRRLRTGGDAQPYFVGILARIERTAVQRGAADQVDAHFADLSFQPFAYDRAGELRAGDGIGAGIGDLAFADEAGVVTDADLELRWPALALRAAHCDSILTHVAQRHLRKVRDHVRRQVRERT